MMEQQFEVWREEVDTLLTSKVEEFLLLGYKNADKEEIWQCVLDKLKNNNSPVRLHVLVNLILSLRLNEYMNRITIQSYRGSTPQSSLDRSFQELVDEVTENKSNRT